MILFPFNISSAIRMLKCYEHLIFEICMLKMWQRIKGVLNINDIYCFTGN